MFKKIALLFLASLMLMLAIGYQLEALKRERADTQATQRYLNDARALFTLLATADDDALKGELAARGFTPADASALDTARLLVEQPHSFGALKIYRGTGNSYLIQIRYMETELLLASAGESDEGWLSRVLVGLDIVLLVAIFVIILAMLAPLRRIAETMRAFAGGDYGRRADVTGRDEIGDVANTFNDMARRLQELITSRETLLRDIGHELRTPIARGLFALERLPDSQERETLQRCFGELDHLTGMLLEIEKLDATGALKNERFDAETLILKALSKTLADETQVGIEIAENFTIDGDPEYLALALKNLIDNALKYTTATPVTIRAEAGTICVCNRGEPLSAELQQLLEPFARAENARSSSGFGLGLSIIRKILDRHGFTLAYRYEEGMHRFCINFYGTLQTASSSSASPE